MGQRSIYIFVQSSSSPLMRTYLQTRYPFAKPVVVLTCRGEYPSYETRQGKIDTLFTFNCCKITRLSEIVSFGH